MIVTGGSTSSDYLHSTPKSNSASVGGHGSGSKQKTHKDSFCELGNSRSNHFIQSLIDECKFLVKIQITFDKNCFPDLALMIGNNILYAHMAVIERRCPSFLSRICKLSSKKGNITWFKVEKVNDFQVLSYILSYLYTSTLPFSTISGDSYILLMQLAKMLQLGHLVWLCERYLWVTLTPATFFPLLKSSNANHCFNVKEICMHFGSLSFRKLVGYKEGVHHLGVELFREFVVHATTPDLIQHNPENIPIPNPIQDDFKEIYSSMNHADAYIHFHEGDIYFHRVIMASYGNRVNTFLKAELNEGPVSLQFPSEVSMSYDAFKSLLSYIYYCDTSFSPVHAAEMLPFLYAYDFPSLISICDQKIALPFDCSSVLPILSLCFHPVLSNQSYSSKLLESGRSFILDHFDQIDLGQLVRFPSSMGWDILSVIQDLLHRRVLFIDTENVQSVNPPNKLSSSKALETT